MDKEEKETADIQIRISKKTLAAIESYGTYEDKNPEGILKRVLPEYEILKTTCPIAVHVAAHEKKEPLIKTEPEEKVAEEISDEQLERKQEAIELEPPEISEILWGKDETIIPTT